MRIRTALLATTLLAAAPVAAMAQSAPGPISGLYVGAGAGYNLLQDEHMRPSPGLGVTNHTRYRFGDGFDGVASVGYGFGNGLRTELEGRYNYNDVNNRVLTGVASNTTGHTESYGALVNVLYDFNLPQFGINLPITPYVGVGAGYLWTHLSPLTSTFDNGSVLRTGGTNGSFAYQGIVGIAYNVPMVPGLAVTAEYRYLGQLNQQAFQGEYFRPTGTAKGNVDFDEQSNHEFMIGLRYAFNQAPPPPPPAPVAQPTPPMAPARTYLVFFD